MYNVSQKSGSMGFFFYEMLAENISTCNNINSDEC